MRQELLQKHISNIPFFREMVDEDLAITIWDRNATCLYFSKANSFPLHFDEGFTIENKQDPIFEAMGENKTIHTKAPKEVFGVAIEGNLVPVVDNGEVVGCITCVFSVEEKAKLIEKSEAMHKTITESKETIINIINTAKTSTEYLGQMQNFLSILQGDVSNVLNTLQLIKKTSNQTKILALNAAIEAARAREAGLGFNIVAKEMGNLSERSTNCVTEIEAALKSMTLSMNDVYATLESLNSLSKIDPNAAENILSKLSQE